MSVFMKINHCQPIISGKSQNKVVRNKNGLQSINLFRLCSTYIDFILVVAVYHRLTNIAVARPICVDQSLYKKKIYLKK